MNLSAISYLFDIYNFLIFLRILLSWIPSIDWNSQPFKFVSSITDPVLNIFRGIIPPIGMLDISPVIAIIALYIVEGLVLRLLAGILV